jgi:DNA-binding NarL/FixJ family response regulator
MLESSDFEYIFKVVKDENEVIEFLKNAANKLVIFGVRKEETACFEKILHVKAKVPEAKILVITDNVNRVLIRRMYDAGILGYIPETHDARMLRNKSELVNNGDLAYMGVASDVLKEILDENRTGKVKKVKSDDLTTIQKELLKAKQEGNSNSECINICGCEVVKDIEYLIGVLLALSGTNNITRAINYFEDTGQIPRRGA